MSRGVVVFRAIPATYTAALGKWFEYGTSAAVDLRVTVRAVSVDSSTGSEEEILVPAYSISVELLDANLMVPAVCHVTDEALCSGLLGQDKWAETCVCSLDDTCA